jgi:hypothetical protein
MINREIVAQFNTQFDALHEMVSEAEASVQRQEIRRICLHCIEAIDNYLTDSPPRKYGGDLKHGIRSRASMPEVPAAELCAYLDSTQQSAQQYLANLDLSCERDAWRRSPLKRVFYVLRHTQYHLGQLSKFIETGYDTDRLCLP